MCVGSGVVKSTPGVGHFRYLVLSVILRDLIFVFRAEDRVNSHGLPFGFPCTLQGSAK